MVQLGLWTINMDGVGGMCQLVCLDGIVGRMDGEIQVGRIYCELMVLTAS